MQWWGNSPQNQTKQCLCEVLSKKLLEMLEQIYLCVCMCMCVYLIFPMFFLYLKQTLWYTVAPKSFWTFKIYKINLLRLLILLSNLCKMVSLEKHFKQSVFVLFLFKICATWLDIFVISCKDIHTNGSV